MNRVKGFIALKNTLKNILHADPRWKETEDDGYASQQTNGPLIGNSGRVFTVK